MLKLRFSVSLLLLLIATVILINQLFLISETSVGRNVEYDRLVLLNITLASIKDDLLDLRKINNNFKDKPLSTKGIITDVGAKRTTVHKFESLNYSRKKLRAILFTMDSISEYEARSKHGGLSTFLFFQILK
jgi:hypothetical protein